VKNVLIVTGQNNHDWKVTSPFFKKVLEDDGRFNVTVTEDPDNYLKADGALDGIDVILLDYNGSMWCEESKAAFVKAIENGTGLVAIHAANNWTNGFDELEVMLGVVWTGVSGHGYYHRFEIEVQKPDHPFAKGLSNFFNYDELYHRLENTQNATFEVIADAYSAPEQKGTGNREPMLIANTYGKGRIIHNLLGHVWPVKEGTPDMRSIDNDDYKALLVRCCLYTAGLM